MIDINQMTNVRDFEDETETSTETWTLDDTTSMFNTEKSISQFIEVTSSDEMTIYDSEVASPIETARIRQVSSTCRSNFISELPTFVFSLLKYACAFVICVSFLLIVAAIPIIVIHFFGSEISSFLAILFLILYCASLFCITYACTK